MGEAGADCAVAARGGGRLGGPAFRQPRRSRLERLRRVGLGCPARRPGARGEHHQHATRRLPRSRARRPGRPLVRRQAAPGPRRRALDAEWSKDEILEAYLNLASFRGETQGIGAAARALFGRAPDALSREDSLLLAALLPAPQAAPPAVARRACRLGRIADCNMMIGQAEAMTGPGRRLADDPGLAPHLAYRLLKKPGETVATTLDPQAQALAAAALRRQLIGLGRERARDGAVIVVDNATAEVIAYVGGVGGASTAPAVDNANSLRQAGSTLKPFLYGQAIERGYLTAASILEYRAAHGGFSSLEELDQVPGIGEARMASLREQVTL